jgi:tRNA(Ile)-lysidine synthase
MTSKRQVGIRSLEVMFLGMVRSAAEALPAGMRWGVGLSGGMDSIVLAEAMRRCDLEVVALHLDHAWRKDSREDASWVRLWCRERKLPCRVRRLRRPPANEAEARSARMDFFRQYSHKEQLAGIWLAQHADDLVETFFLQLMRGAGPEGLASLHPDREVDGLRLLRALLPFEKKELKKLARHWKLEWREDGSNQSDRHRRNRVRHRLIPTLRKWMDRDPMPLIYRTATILASENEYWESILPARYPSKVPVQLLESQPVAYQRRYLRAWLKSQGVGNASFEQIEGVRELLSGGRPARANLSGKRYVRRTRARLYIE